MRTLFLLPGLLTACVSSPPPATASSAAAGLPACPLVVVAAPPTLTFPDTQQALRDFDQSPDTAYRVLYIRKVAGAPGSNRCLLLRQWPAGRLLVHSYGAQRIGSAQVADSTWHPLLAHLAATPGHLRSMCLLTTDPSLEFLLVKHRGTIVFSLAWETYRLGRLPAAQEARLAPALALMRRLRY